FGLDPAQFRYAVCHFIAEEQCDGKEFAINCEHIDACYREFREQIYGHGGKDLLPYRRGKSNKKKKKEGKAAKYVVKAYPTAFMSDNENWKKVIKRILADGDNNREQDKIEAGSI
ncbi:MAG TPA: hypothetical protein VMV86_03745, partial [Methanosarcinales archaeon]|nr:hypothetical protein [Methanosarcinales archaeon]